MVLFSNKILSIFRIFGMIVEKLSSGNVAQKCAQQPFLIIQGLSYMALNICLGLQNLFSDSCYHLIWQMPANWPMYDFGKKFKLL